MLGSYVVPVVGVYVTKGDVPTFTSNVSLVLFATVNHVLNVGSVGLGYVLLAVLPSIVHDNTNEFSKNLILSPLARP